MKRTMSRVGNALPSGMVGAVLVTLLCLLGSPPVDLTAVSISPPRQPPENPPEVDPMGVAADPVPGPVYLPTVFTISCIDFSDDFSDPLSGWAVGEDDTVRYGYLDGEYRILTQQSGDVYFYRAPISPCLTYVIETDARWVGTMGHSYGLIFGVTADQTQYYLFTVRSDLQQYRLYSRGPDGEMQIVAPTYSASIRSGLASNHLKVTRDNQYISLEVNGVPLGTWYDRTITGPTWVGVASSPTLNVPASDARFDNYRVSRPSP